MKRNKNVYPLLYMRGMKFEDLLAILEFLYCGETNVYQENLDSFLSIAEELELKGLMGNSKQEEEDMSVNPSGLITPRNTAFKEETRMVEGSPLSSSPVTLLHSPVCRVALANDRSDNMQKLDEQINDMMTKSSRKNIHGQPLYVCNSCGKESKQGNIKEHLEARK